MSKQKVSLAPIISTIIVAVLAIVVAVVAIVLITSEDGPSSQSTPDTGVSAPAAFAPTQEQVDECTYAAHDLVAAHYKAVRLFVTEGLDHLPEPYGNEPDGGYYTVDSAAYKTLDDITELLNSIYTAEKSASILTDLDGKGIQVYKNREILVKVEETYEGTAEPTAEATDDSGSVQYATEYVLGIHMDFVPAADYGKDWSTCRIAVTPVSETECKLVVYLNGVDPETATDADADSVLNMSMIKGSEGWRLATFVY